jgi:hypothetical protein
MLEGSRAIAIAVVGLVPASTAVPAATAEQKNDNHNNEQGGGRHVWLLRVGREAEHPTIIGSVSFGRTVGHQKDHALFNTAHVVSSARDAEQPRTRRRAELTTDETLLTYLVIYVGMIVRWACTDAFKLGNANPDLRAT